MAKHVESLTLNLPVDYAVDACIAAFVAGRWKVLRSDGRSFMIKEQLGLVAMMFSYPARAVILLRDQEEVATRVELHGAMFGFGPIQAKRVRTAIERLRADIERAATAAAEAA